MAIQQASIARGGSMNRAPRPSNLAEVLDLILDKGIVIDAYVRVSAIGIEILTIDARIVVASVDTYLRFAEAVNRLDLEQTPNTMTLQDLQKGRGKEERTESGTKGALEGARDFFRGDKEEKKEKAGSRNRS